MSKKIKKIDIKEFVEKGYLQELNRRFLHPLGLALAVEINDENGECKLESVWDYREDVEGIYFDLKNSDRKRIEKFKTKCKYIDDEFYKKQNNRVKLIGSIIEEIPE